VSGRCRFTLQLKRKSGTGFTEIQWQGYTFKFLPGNRMAQVIDPNNHVIGTILDQGGDLQLLPAVTGDEADKLQKAFQAWKDSGGEAAVGYKVATPSNSANSSGAAASSPSSASAPAKSALTVDRVISMLQAGISEDVIVEKIRKSGQTLDLSSDDMVRLKNAKASDTLMKAMLDSDPGATPPSAPAAAATTSATRQATSTSASATPPRQDPKRPRVTRKNTKGTATGWVRY
jgi:hypothetical protein